MKRTSLPSRDELLAFIRERSGNVGTREIARAFGAKNADRAELKRMLRDLTEGGHIERRRKKLHHPGTLPPVVLADITGRDSDGELLARPTEWDEDAHGAAPVIRIAPLRRARPGEVAGVGDRALLRVERAGEETNGRVIKLIDRAKHRVLGIFRGLPGGGGRLVPIDKKQLGRELTIARDHTGDAVDGDLVAVEVARHGRLGLPAGSVVERLGSLKSERAVSLIAIHAHGLPHTFSRSLIGEAEAARPATLDGREDWREVAFVTIDPPDAKDHDDAVHAVPDPDPHNKGGHLVSVAIADVAHYVRPGSALDRAALERGNSVYFPDRVVPMLPERISNDLCSLRAAEDRPALAVRMILGADGRKRSHRFHRIMMRSAAKLAYEQAQAAIDGRPDMTTAPLVETVLKPLYTAHAAINLERGRRDPLALDLPERKLVLDKEGRLAGVRWPERLDAHRLIEEFMILANVAAAETLEAQHSPLLYRAHDAPSVEKLNDLIEFLGTIGVKLARGDRVRPSHFNSVLSRVKGQGVEALVNEVVLRAQAQAEYSHENYGHFGLNLRRYAHFTSPIRRYADLVVHRALIRTLGLGNDGLQDLRGGELAQVAEHISAAERRAMAAERETVDRLVAAHLADRVGAEFEARVAGVTRVGLFVKLAETGADGFVPAGTLGDDYFRFEEGIRALVGTRSGVIYRLGDPVRVRLVEAAPFAGALRFEIVADDADGAPLRRGVRRARTDWRERTATPRGGRR